MLKSKNTNRLFLRKIKRKNKAKKNVAKAILSPLIKVIIPHNVRYKILNINNKLLRSLKLIKIEHKPNILNLAMKDPGTRSLKGPDNLP